MSGHSHFANIMRTKARVDAKRGQEFSKISRLIMAAVRTGGPQVRDNLRLAYAVDLARAANMGKDTIQRAIERASGAAGGAAYEEVTFEAYAPSGVAMLIQALTDNRHRTAPEVKHVVERNGGHLGATGSVAWLFERKGRLEVAAAGADEDRLFEVAIDAGADDVERAGEGDGAPFAILCPAHDLAKVRDALAAAPFDVRRFELVMHPKQTVSVTEQAARSLMRLQSLLEDMEDVQSVATNADVPAEVAARLAAESEG